MTDLVERLIDTQRERKMRAILKASLLTHPDVKSCIIGVDVVMVELKSGEAFSILTLFERKP